MTVPVLLIRRGADVPWGFRLHGGTDQQTPLTVQRVTPGSVASTGLFVGDEILRIGNTDADRMTYAVAMETIKTSGDRLELYTSRTGLPANTQPISNNNYSHSPQITSNDVGETRHDSFNQPQSSHLYDGGHPQDNVGRPEPEIPKQLVSSPVVQPPQTPDAVLNIASRAPQDKRPWAYAPDIQSLQQQRQRVQRRNLPPTKVDSPRIRPTNQSASPQQYQPYQATQQYQPYQATQQYQPYQATQQYQPYQTSQQYQPYQAYQTPQTTSHLQDREVEQNGEVGVGVGHENIYSGSEIPSKTFKLLQSFTSFAPNQPPSSNTGLARAAQRRQRRREKLQIFDDLISDGTVEKSQEPEFDEAAYLAGRIPIIGSGSTKPVPPRSHAIVRTDNEPVEEEREDENKKPFDERAYLAGRIPLVSGGPINPELFNLPIPDATSPAAAAAAADAGEDGGEGRDENKKPFDERAYLAGRIPLVKGGTIDPTQFNVPERRVVKKYKDVNRPRLRQPFDEKSYLAGKLNILGETNDRPPRREALTASSSNNSSVDVKPSWCKGDEDMVSEDEYSEDSFLKGRIAIVRRSVDRELPQRRAPDVTGKARYRLDRATWQKGEPDDDGRGGICSDTEFDERAYLAGRWRGQHLAPDKEYSTDTETDAPSKTLRILRRSVSSERSTDEDWRCLASGDEAGSDQEAPYDCYMYQGRNIPSKIFSRLKRTMDRKAAAEHKTRSDDPIERLREKSLEQVGIDVDTAIERMEIGQHDPDTYMKLLKQSVEQNDNIRIEPDNEVTDF